MLQAMLEDRFRLAVHRDTRQLPTYALSVGKEPFRACTVSSGIA